MPASKANAESKASEGAAGFVRKLYMMVDDADITEIEWSEDGESFFIKDQQKLQQSTLARFFKHNKLSSLIRQLNMYDFNKVQHPNEGALTGSGEELLEFRNPNFKRGHPELLKHLERKRTASEKGGGAAKELAVAPGLDPHAVFAKLTEIREEQKALSTEFKRLERENQLLWQETQTTRDLHKRNSESINAIVRFLGQLYGAKVLEPGQASPTPSGSATPVVPPQRRRLLLKGSEGIANLSGLSQEVEIPFEADDDLPVISSDRDYLNGTARADDNADQGARRTRQESGTGSDRFEEVGAADDQLDPQLAQALSLLSKNPKLNESPDLANLLSSYNFDTAASVPANGSSQLALAPRTPSWPLVLSNAGTSLAGQLPGLLAVNSDVSSGYEDLEKRRSANMKELERISNRTDGLQSQIDDLMRGLVPSDQQADLEGDEFWHEYLNDEDKGDILVEPGRIEQLSRSPSVAPTAEDADEEGSASKKRRGTKRPTSDDDDFVPSRRANARKKSRGKK